MTPDTPTDVLQAARGRLVRLASECERQPFAVVAIRRQIAEIDADLARRAPPPTPKFLTAYVDSFAA